MEAPVLDANQEIPILTTKLYIPPVRPGQVSRPRLLERLDDSLGRKLVLISAPAGFGKTTLLAEWVSRLQAGQPGAWPATSVAWYSLDESDNDPARFAAYLVAALQATGLASQSRGLGVWPARQAPAQEMFLATLINEISDLGHRLVLILDDYHLVNAKSIHQAVGYLLDHLPDNVLLVLSTRADPPLSLARLRARGQLIELRQTDLRFTAQEAAGFLNHTLGVKLSTGDVAALEARTEGWIAGLQMAALALQPLAAAGRPRHSAELAASIRAFSGSHRYVLDYLVEEVLEQQPAATQEFLLRTSILKRLSAPLCDAVLEAGAGQPPAEAQPPSQALLEELDQANLFILPLDGERRWYRYHRLFADLLRKRLRQAHPRLVPELHRRAGAWCEDNGWLAAAIDHALAAGDLERAADLVEATAETVLMRSEVATLANWIDRLPPEIVRARPSLCAHHAWALLVGGHPWHEVEARIGDAVYPEAETGDRQEPPEIVVLRAWVSLFRGDMSLAAELAEQALAILPDGDRFLRNVALWSLGIAALSQGDQARGQQLLQQVARTSQEAGNLFVAVMVLCNLAEGQMKLGQLHRAQRIYEQAIEAATDAQGQRLPIAGQALVGLGELARKWHRLELATQYLEEGLALVGLFGKAGKIEGYVGLARVKQSQGDLEDAQEALDQARELAVQFDATELDDMIVSWQQIGLWIARGDLTAAQRQAETLDIGQEVDPEEMSAVDAYIRSHTLKYEQTVLARLRLAQGRPEQALILMKPLAERMEEQGRHDLAIESRLLQALAHQALHQTADALEAVGKALTLAEPGGYVQVFLDEGELMARLLRQAASQGAAAPYARELLASFETPEGAPFGEGLLEPPHSIHNQLLVEPLSERELEVLRLLDTGISNAEIADRLYIAVSTVRSHLKSIYGKLDVHRRWDAVQRARELKLI